MVIKATKKLLNELHINPDEPSELPSFFSWHANILKVNRRKAVLLLNDATRMPVLLYGLTATEFKNLSAYITEAIRETLLAYGVSQALVDKYLDEAGAVTYATTDDRSLVATMNHTAISIPFFVDQLTLDSLNQIAYNLRFKDYPIKIGSQYVLTETLLLQYMTMLENGEVLEDDRQTVHQKAFQFMVRLAMDSYDIWRRIIVPANVTFTNLHFIIQDCFNWLSYHRYDFRIMDNQEHGKQIAMISDEQDMTPVDTKGASVYSENTSLETFVPTCDLVVYSYDYGDGWEHYCKLEKVIDDYSLTVPTCIEGNGNAPPEDVGGENGFAHFLNVIHDKTHPDHQQMSAWGKRQRFTHFDIVKINKKLRRSLKRK
jgi:hypothetical protein